MRSIPRSRCLGLAVAAIAALTVAPPGAAEAAPPGQPAKAPPADQQVTLITGDRITLTGGDPARASVQRGPGRTGVSFSVTRAKDRLSVVPSDVQHQVAAGLLDRRLFDVTGLIKAGYDDRSTQAIPLVVTSMGRSRALAGATTTRRLPVVDGAAMRVEKAKAAAFLTGLGADGVRKVWLDGLRKPSLDRSVPRIGAPAAWQAGYTGRGVPVAVLDTGIDKTHPDLAGRIAGARNFTMEPGDDLVGHGTHVASTIAGTAAASNGKAKGVAPEADLYDAKVCEASGCPESAILAGMEWAATEVKAKVVNVSLGGTDTPELDPIEEAVNRLTAQTGALFVVAAGNDGPDQGTVASPGSADAALTVGAVDRTDQLADFSGRGPRLGDGAVKPDVTAPGVDIVAAKAAKSQIGEPAGDQYLTLSGTSMATPHTAGAAALLAQRHPGWRAADLKAALIASAEPAAGQTAFEQGAGRIDVGRGIGQSVVAEPGSLSFGTAVWPHDDDAPVTRPLTYRNFGDQLVTLDLTATMTGPDGQAAPAGALELSASTVTVPARGTASIQVTSSTKHSGPDGGYSGRVVATGDTTRVVTAIGLVKEAEMYDLTVTNLGPDGGPHPARGLIFGLGVDVFTEFGTASLKVRLPKGEYSVSGDQLVDRPGGAGRDLYSLAQPSIELTENTTVVLDARTARPVKVTVPEPGATVAMADVGFYRRSADGMREYGWGNLVSGFDGVYTAQVGPALPPEQLTGHVVSVWTQEGPNTPYVYGQADTMPGRYPTGFVRDVEATGLAVAELSFHATTDRRSQWVVQPGAPHMGGTWSVGLDFDVPATTKFYADDQPVTWDRTFLEIDEDPDPEQPPVMVTALSPPDARYVAGRTYRERYNAAAFTATPQRAVRQGDRLTLSAYGLTDADGNKGRGAVDSATTRLSRDGQVVAETRSFGFIEAGGLPAEKATYTLETSQTRQMYSKFSTRTELRWAFSSAANDTVLPMLGVRYRPKVDAWNVAERQPLTVLPVIVEGAPGAELPRIVKLEIQVSGDEGKSWRKAAVRSAGTGRYEAVFATPARSVSLKARLVDSEGNVTEQTVIGAYPVR